jgi:hypothetical protein
MRRSGAQRCGSPWSCCPPCRLPLELLPRMAQAPNGSSPEWLERNERRSAAQRCTRLPSAATRCSARPAWSGERGWGRCSVFVCADTVSVSCIWGGCVGTLAARPRGALRRSGGTVPDLRGGGVGWQAVGELGAWKRRVDALHARGEELQACPARSCSRVSRHFSNSRVREQSPPPHPPSPPY